MSLVRRMLFGITAGELEGCRFSTKTFSNGKSNALICADTSVLLCIVIALGLAAINNLKRVIVGFC